MYIIKNCSNKKRNIFSHMVSVEPFIWKDLQKTISMTKVLKCESRSKVDNIAPFYIQVRSLKNIYKLLISINDYNVL
jgi:hypothetical protein